MTTRQAELAMALLMAAFSGYLMGKSTELSTSWNPDEGPGGGFWPFWLSTIMLGCCAWTVVNWLRRVGGPASDETAFFGPGVAPTVGIVAAALVLTTFLFDGAGYLNTIAVGAYVALPLFMIFYMRYMGRHSWLACAIAGVTVPVVSFFFFEGLLAITLPKGVTEPLFYPLYALIY